MSSLAWMPVNENADEPPQCLEALTPNGARYRTWPIHHANTTIEGWSLTLTIEPDSATEDLGHFEDAVSAQLHAQQHHDTTSS